MITLPAELYRKLYSLDLDELTSLTEKSRKILWRSYRRRKIPAPAWVVPPKPRKTQ